MNYIPTWNPPDPPQDPPEENPEKQPEPCPRCGFTLPDVYTAGYDFNVSFIVWFCPACNNKWKVTKTVDDDDIPF